MPNRFLSVLCIALAAPYRDEDGLATDAELLDFVCAELNLQPLLRRQAIRLATLGWWGLVEFQRLCLNRSRNSAVLGARHSWWPPLRLLYRFYHTLVLLRLYDSDDKTPARPLLVLPAAAGVDHAATVVVGSGPSGALVATLLAERGEEVLLLEEGAVGHQRPPYGTREMLEAMRWGGIGVIPARVPISYVEACALGGGSEINSGLYLRAAPDVLAQWTEQLGRDLELLPHFIANENELSVGADGPSGPTVEPLQRGAEALGWRWERLATLTGTLAGANRADFRAMTQTLLPRFIAAGGKIATGCRVEAVKPLRQGWALQPVGRSAPIRAQRVVLAAGALQTPRLLQASGLGGALCGHGLHSSIVVKVVAEFREPLSAALGLIGAVQVREFAPRFTFGSAVSSRAQLALAMAGYEAHGVAPAAGNRAVFSLIYAPEGRGRVTRRGVRYPLGDGDWRGLGEGLVLLCRLLFAAGATTLYPVAERARPLRSESDITAIPARLDRWRPQLLTLHPTATCAMGADTEQGVVDIDGRLFGAKDLWVCDASTLPGYPGANPQATVMAVARRQAEKLIAGLPH